MSRHLQKSGAPFCFTPENLKKAQMAIGQYPQGRQASAVKSLLDLGQRQNQGWISQEIVEEVAKILDMPVMRVYEVVSFYTLFNLQPLGRVHVQVCTTTPCWLRGSDVLLSQCQARALAEGSDALTVKEVECLGACVNAPVIQIQDDFYEDLDSDSVATLLDAVLQGKSLKPGSQTGRVQSAPQGYKIQKKSKKGQTDDA